MMIEIRLFQYFVAVAEEEHFGRAASRLGIAAATLTHQIQKLERQLGTRLLVRNKRSLFALTEAGSRFLERAKVVLKEADEAAEAARQAGRGETGTIEIGYMAVAASAGLIQRFIPAFQRENPNVEIVLHHQTTMSQIRAILDGRLDFGFARQPNQYPSSLRGFVVHRQQLVIAIPADHPLAQETGAIDPARLKSEIFVNTSVETDLGFYRQIESVAAQGAFTPRVSKRSNDMLTVLTYVAAGYGIAVCAEALSRVAFPNIVYRRIKGRKMPGSSIAFLHRRQESSPAASRMIAFMRRHAIQG